MIRALSTAPTPIVTAVREFVAREVEPAAAALEYADAYPHALVARMKDISGRAIANLGVDKLKHEQPTFIGDTLYARSTVLELTESRKGDRGVVTVETIGTNQRGDTVCSYIRKVLVPKRSHGTLGEGKLPY